MKTDEQLEVPSATIVAPALTTRLPAFWLKITSGGEGLPLGNVQVKVSLTFPSSLNDGPRQNGQRIPG